MSTDIVVHIVLIYVVLGVFVALWLSHRRTHEFELRSREFTLFDVGETGHAKEVANMQTWAGGGGLSFYDGNGVESASLGLGAADLPLPKSGDLLRHIRLGTLGSLVSTIPTLHLKGTGQVLLADGNDRLRARLALDDRCEPSLTFYDHRGNVIWKAP